MTTVTQWFGGIGCRLKPARSGVYQVKRGGSTYFAYFSISRGWGFANRSVEEANGDRDPFGAIQGKTWRGLAERAK